MGLFDWLRGTKPPAVAWGSTLQEGVWTGAATYDPDSNLTAAQGGSAYFRRLTHSARDLDPIRQERALEIAYYLFDSNPLAKRVLELTRDFVIGDGVTIQSSEAEDGEPDEVQETVDRFWRANEWDLKLHSRVLELGLTGELCLPEFTNPVDGSVTLGYIDPSQIAEVVVNPSNDEEITAVVLKGEPGQRPPRLRAIRPSLDPTDRWFGRTKALERDASGRSVETYQDQDGREYPWDGSCFLFSVNKVTNARRGRSDLLCLADWLDAYDQILFGEVDRAQLLKSFVWDVTLEGATDEQISAYLKTNGSPKPGSVRAHNQAVKWEAVTPDLKAVDAQIGADLLLSYISAGSGHPKTWLAGTLDVNRATAAELGEPAFKRLMARQRYVRHILEAIATFVLDQAEIHGKVPKRPSQPGVRPEPWPLEVQLPEVRGRDLNEAADTFKKSVEAASLAQLEHLIDRQVAQEVTALAIGQLGIDVDLEAMRERIETEVKEQEAKEQEMFDQQADLAMQQSGGKPNGKPNGRPRSVAEAVAEATKLLGKNGQH